MKKLIYSLLVLLLLLTACGKRITTTWEEQYDLGKRYLSEVNYEEAVVAFNEAIEIDPKQVAAYVGLAEAYIGMGDYAKAGEAIAQGQKACGNHEDFDRILNNLSFLQTGEVGVKITASYFDKEAYLAGEETDFLVSVAYRCPENENCVLMIGANTQEPYSFVMMDEEYQVEGSGGYQFHVSVEPVQWKEFYFGIYVNLSETDHQETETTFAWDALYIDSDGAICSDERLATEYINRSNDLLEAGNLRQALLVLYEGAAFLDSDMLEQAIDEYFRRVTFEITANPSACEPEFCFDEIWESDTIDVKPHNYGLNLRDLQTEVTQTVIQITLMVNEWWTPDASDGGIVNNREGHCFFYIWSGEGRAPTFYYDIQSNTFKILETGITYWDILEDRLVAEALSFAVDEEHEMYVFDWDANIILKRDIYSKIVKDGLIYYFAQEEYPDKDVWGVYRITPDGNDETRLCSIELEGGYAYFEDNSIGWYSNGKDNYMDLSAPYDVWLEDQEIIINNLCRQIEEHYTKLWNPSGNYVCFDNECRITETGYEFVLRYQMSDEEVEERIASGAMVGPNIYTTTVWVNKKTGEVTDEWEEDSWYANVQ